MDGLGEKPIWDSKKDEVLSGIVAFTFVPGVFSCFCILSELFNMKQENEY